MIALRLGTSRAFATPRATGHALLAQKSTDSHIREEMMKKVLTASGFLLALTGFANAAELTQAEAQKISQSLEDQFVQAFKAKQPEKIASLFTDDGWRITDVAPVIGKAALLKHFEGAVKAFDLTEAHIDQVKVLDNESIQTTGQWEGTLKLPNLPPQPQAGFWVETATKQKDGTWKVAMEAYNVKMPVPPSGAKPQ
jgi:uncharacterized protein (TIGR02246 family)